MSDHLKERLLEALEKSPNLMISLNKNADHSEPMQISFLEERRDAFWIFTKKNNRLSGGGKASASYMTKDHQLFGSFCGHLRQEEDMEIIKSLFTLSVSAWYEDGVVDDSLEVLRFDINSLEIWLKEVSMLNKMTIATGGTLDEQEVGEHAVYTEFN